MYMIHITDKYNIEYQGISQISILGEITTIMIMKSKNRIMDEGKVSYGRND